MLGSLRPVDLAIIGAYFVFVLYLGQRNAGKNRSEDGFYLANRSVGKLYQFFLNFGQSTDPQSAVSTASIVYQAGISGIWLMLQSLFVNPFYWFMNLWFRRARLTTVADLFEDRLGSRGLARFYSILNILLAVVVVNGFANYVSYQIVASLIVKPEAAWTRAERRSVADYQEMGRLERATKAGPLPVLAERRLRLLRDMAARGELHSYVTLVKPWIFYLCFNLVVGAYIVLGGMHAMMRTEALQGTLTLIFSAMLIPVGLSALGGWHALAARVPPAMLELFGGASSQVTGSALLAVLFVSIVQAPAQISNMNVSGAARNEFVARFGAVSGTYAKRIMIILWGITGLIAIGLYQGPTALSDPDAVWGTLGRTLLGPGLLGLMLAGVLAGSMSAGSMQSMTVSALFVRNVYRPLRPGIPDRQAVAAGRWAVVAFLIASALSASLMRSAFSIVQLFLLMHVPFGASILTLFLWRRLTAAAVWMAVCASALLILIVPAVVPWVPALAARPALVALAPSPTGGQPIYFESVVHSRPGDLGSPLVGRGRFHAELYLLHLAGCDPAGMSAGARLAARFLFSGLFPFAFLVLGSLFTRPAPGEMVDRFYGRMKTPVGATPELEQAALAETRRDPHRFDHLKLFPGTSLELTKWDRTDALGFAACCAVAGAIFAAFAAFVRLAGRA